MPVKSKAQRRKFAELLVEGKISPETFEEWNRGAGSAELPERLHPKRTRKTKRRATEKRTKGRATAKRTKRSPRKRAARARKRPRSR